MAHLACRHDRIRQEIQRLKAMDEALADAPDGQISLTDPDARAMATSARRSGLDRCNVQSAVDTKTHIIVAHDVTNQGFDREQLGPMGTVVLELGVDTDRVLSGEVSGQFTPAQPFEFKAAE